MIKSELVTRLSQEMRLSAQDAKVVVDTIFDEIVKTLSEGGRVELRNFGIFSMRTRKSRMGRNPKTGEQVFVSEKKIPYFKAGKAVVNALNGKK